MICFAWSEFPQYAARCVGALVKATTNESIAVVATRPRVPIKGMETLSGCPVYWIDVADSRPIKEIVGASPRILFTSGWGTAVFNRYRDEVHIAGGRVIAMSDNNFVFTLKEIVKSIRFRLKFKGMYDGYFVAGRSCARLLHFYGVPASEIRIGIYSADASLFGSKDSPICTRPKKIIFVGQLCERKNPVRLCEAFKNAGGHKKGWVLELYGCGPLKDSIPRYEGISVHDFLQPDALANKYRGSRVFCLPSLEEHWGLVVHEAALSGCYLLLSRDIGSAADFLGEHNGQTFNPQSLSSIQSALERAMSLSDEELRLAQNESEALASQITLDRFVENVRFFL